MKQLNASSLFRREKMLFLHVCIYIYAHICAPLKFNNSSSHNSWFNSFQKVLFFKYMN